MISGYAGTARPLGSTEPGPGCPFCSPTDVLTENAHAYAMPDRYPVGQGHSLVIPKRHVADLFDLADKAYADCFALVREVRQRLEARYRPAGFNVGINSGRAAGQTIFHAHIHVIPRYEGDVADPTGGVRNIIPGKGRY
jgi:diadenosine tetraphosphate (Ap4A) HIT family hydrolase